MNTAQRRTDEFGKPIIIGNDAWVGGGTILCQGVSIGSKTVIGARRVVTRSIAEGLFRSQQSLSCDPRT